MLGAFLTLFPGRVSLCTFLCKGLKEGHVCSLCSLGFCQFTLSLAGFLSQGCDRRLCTAKLVLGILNCIGKTLLHHLKIVILFHLCVSSSRQSLLCLLLHITYLLHNPT